VWVKGDRQRFKAFIETRRQETGDRRGEIRGGRVFRKALRPARLGPPVALLYADESPMVSPVDAQPKRGRPAD